MQEYTLFQDSAHTQTVDIPAFGGKLDVSWNPESQVTQWGGLAYFVSYLKTSGLFDRLVEDAPFHYTSPNAPDVRDIVGTTVLAIVCGFTRYVHINRLRNDTALAALLGLGRIRHEGSEAVPRNRTAHRHRGQLVEHLLPAGGRRQAPGTDDISSNVHGRRRTARHQRTETAPAPHVHASQGEGDAVFAHAPRRVHETNFRNCGAVGL